MSRFDAIDLSRLPPPKVVEALDYEAIRQQMLDDFRQRWPEFDAALESEPVVKLLEVAAFREMLLRQRVNDAARAVMLASATGTDLENLAAYYGVARRLLSPGDPDATPPVPPQYEEDEEFRRRVQLAIEAQATTGTQAGYIFHVLQVDPVIRDVGVRRVVVDEGGQRRVQVHISFLIRDGDGRPSQQLIQSVIDHLNRDDVRPLTDEVVVTMPEIVTYDVHARLALMKGPDPAIVRRAAEENVSSYTQGRYAIGKTVFASGLIAALQVDGVEAVDLMSPAGDVVPPAGGAARIASLSIEITQ